eukprot:14708457-Alexandrium_andersonii.AAC.1
MSASLVGSEMCIRDSFMGLRFQKEKQAGTLAFLPMTNEVTVAERAAPGVRADGVLATVGVAGKAADMTVLLRKPEPADQDCTASGFFAGQGTPHGGSN